MPSINDAIKSLLDRHKQYIEANFHISHPRLVKERRMLMEEEAQVASRAWVQATPTYVVGAPYDQLGLPQPVVDVLSDFSKAGVNIFKRPYEHQSKALRSFFVDGKDLIISTGTGSGKTEIFLYSILGNLALEAERHTSTDLRAMRAIILYPMNALVSDQLGRLRRLLGRDSGAKPLKKRFGRNVQFGMYTSRTPYHGLFDPDRNERTVEPIVKYYLKLQEDDNRKELYADLKKKGRIPEKDLRGFLGGSSDDKRFRTQPGDTELLTRQEMHSTDQNPLGGAPDILITNYSMLEYMLLRPIEQPLFDTTKEWLAKDPKNQLLIVLDEAHLYRGAQGAEVALLIRRLIQHLGIKRNRVRFILTSATLGGGTDVLTKGKRFAADLTASDPSEFEVILGKKIIMGDGKVADTQTALSLSRLGYNTSRENIKSVGSELSWDKDLPEDSEQMMAFVGSQLERMPVFRLLYDTVTEAPVEQELLATRLFKNTDPQLAKEATLNLLHLGSQAQRLGGDKLMPSRLHMFFRGLPRQFICINPLCTQRRSESGKNDFLGRMYAEPRLQCECGARVFELLTHRTCGSAYIRAFRHVKDRDQDAAFLWTEAERGDQFDELHLLVESPRTDPDTTHKKKVSLKDQFPPRFIDVRTGHLISKPSQFKDQYLEVRVPREQVGTGTHPPWSWRRCPACGISDRRSEGESTIMDLETKGEEVFASLVRTEFEFQPTQIGSEGYPNRGRKVLCFSDSRQKAARLARDLQRTVERDAFRETIVESAKKTTEKSGLATLYPAFLISTLEHKTQFFDDAESDSRTNLVSHQMSIPEILADNDLGQPDDILTSRDALEEFEGRPAQYDEYLLRMLGDKYYSLRETLVGYLVPREDVMRLLTAANDSIDPEVLRSIVIEVLAYACDKRAYDPDISDTCRKRSRRSAQYPQGYPLTAECLDPDDLTPKYLMKLAGTNITEEQWKKINKSLRKHLGGDEIPRLFGPNGNQRYAINPEAVLIHIALNDTWFRCEGCRQFTPIGIYGKCPECGGRIVALEQDDPHLTARKTLLREPCREVLDGKRAPFVLRSEEHSAQLSERDLKDVIPRSENYELLFQDIILSENPYEQPVDVLSCTTTMEVGIDIGSLTGVALRTVPPLPANYQQRSGRAGRRGASLSTIITFADNSPQEVYNFHNPKELIGTSPETPVIYVGNQKICERHINASLIERFFHAVPVPRTADVFSSLGSASSFFRGSEAYSLKRFKSWIEKNILVSLSTVATEIGQLLPDELGISLGKTGSSWRADFVRSAAREFLDRLEDISSRADWPSGDDEEDSLLRALLDAALLPTFSFPIDVCTFTVRESDRSGRKVARKYEMSLGLRQALSDYAPGREIVVDKRTFRSYGLHYPFPNDLMNRAAGPHWQQMKWLNFCETCETVLEDSSRNLQALGQRCPIARCNSPLRSIQLLRPMGFAPRSADSSEGEVADLERAYAQPAKLPLPVNQARSAEKVRSEKDCSLKRGTIRRMSNQELIVANLGPRDNGYPICQSCGAIGESGTLPTQHSRPYPKDVRYRRRWFDRCSGQVTQAALGYSFRTDLSILRTRVQRPLSWSFDSRSFRAAAQTLSEALVIGATRSLGIDTNELAGDYRPYPRYLDDPPDILGYVDFFLYDTTPGGAGFAAKAYDSFDKILQTTDEILDCDCGNSCHSCLRTYENRRFHDTLDRHLGISLLTYIRQGEVPPIDANRSTELLTRMGLSMKIIDHNIETEIQQDKMIVKLGDRSLSVILRSSLLEKTADQQGVIYVTDYDALNDLPTVVHGVVSRLKQLKT